MTTDGASVLFTFMTMVLELAVGTVAQLAVEVIMTITLSLLFKVVLLKTDPVPELLPLTNH